MKKVKSFVLVSALLFLLISVFSGCRFSDAGVSAPAEISEYTVTGGSVPTYSVPDAETETETAAPETPSVWYSPESYTALVCPYPDGERKLFASVVANDAEIIFVEDRDEYTPACEIRINRGVINSVTLIKESMRFEDLNGDGYGDFVVADTLDGETVWSVYLYNVYSGEYQHDLDSHDDPSGCYGF